MSFKLFSPPRRLALVALVLSAPLAQASSVQAAPVQSAPMQAISTFEIDRTEVTIGQFRQYVQATGVLTQAERAGGGSTFEAGWEQRRGWL